MLIWYFQYKSEVHIVILLILSISFVFQALQASKYEDWFWKVALGKCYFRLGMFRDAERMFKSALKMQEMIDILLLLAKVWRVYNLFIQFENEHPHKDNIITRNVLTISGLHSARSTNGCFGGISNRKWSISRRNEFIDGNCTNLWRNRKLITLSQILQISFEGKLWKYHSISIK